MNLLTVKFCALIAVVIFTIGVNSIKITSASNSNNVVFPDKYALNEASSKEWLAKWWIWWTGIPNDIHPANKYPDINRCSAMQKGQVWFLPNIFPGKNVEYRCEIPIGTDILLPISTTECENGTVEGQMSDIELQECAFNILTPIDNIEVILDGAKIDLKNLGQPIQTNFFNVTYPQNPLDLWGEVKPGIYRAIAEGYFLFLNNLDAGNHIIKMKVVDMLKGNIAPEFPAEGTYDITIKQ